jgi:hypothetical protein
MKLLGAQAARIRNLRHMVWDLFLVLLVFVGALMALSAGAWFIAVLILHG